MNKTLRVGLRGAVLLALLARATSAEAGSPPRPVDELVAEAHAAVRAGRLADARALWLAIWKVEPSQQAACNIGALAFRLNDARAAVKWLSDCKAMMRPPSDPSERTLYESRLLDLERARQSIGEIRVQAPSGASVTIDGEAAEIGAPVPVDPGRHAVEATLRSATVKIDVAVGRGQLRQVNLNAELAAALDAAARAPAPRPAPPGPHLGVVLGGFGASAALLAVGAGLMVFANDEADHAEASARSAGPNRCFRDEVPACREAKSSWQAMETAQTAGTISFVAAGALAVGTAIYLVLPRHRAEIVATPLGISLKRVW